jgi:hypothetical protein
VPSAGPCPASWIKPLLLWIQNLSWIAGWWYTYPSEKYEFVSWDDDIPNILGHIKNVPKFQTTNQIVSTGGPKRRFHKMGNTDLEGPTEPCLAVDAWPDPSTWLNYMLLRTPK